MRLPSLIILAVLCQAAHGLSIPPEFSDAFWEVEKLIMANERLGAKFLRLAFHDCVGPSCDGCINLKNPDNGGLNIPIDALESIYKPGGVETELSRTMSRADLWALAGIVGVEIGREAANHDVDTGIGPLPIDFKGGRKDCPTSPYTTEMHEFPSAHMGSNQTYKYFADNFGLSMYDTVALMGAHTLGRAKKEHTGFEGTWTVSGRKIFHFDATYHHNMVVPDYGWNITNIGTDEDPKYVWKCTDLAKPETMDRDCGIMLDTDIGMLLDLTVDEKGKPTCEFFTLDQRTCKMMNWDQVYSYENFFFEDANHKFAMDFSRAFDKVISKF